ncbi:MAG: undecaprenyl-diphosphate phosphatase [Nitrososphaerales archaeon]
MYLAESLLLGFIQGLTEWLPISSSGHLAVVETIFGVEEPLLFNVALHTATLIVLIVYFRRDLVQLALAAISLDFSSKQGKLIPSLVAGTIPTAIVGLILYEHYTTLFNFELLGFSFSASGMLVLASKIREGYNPVSTKTALLIGLAQALSIAPGFSRSGLTISIALLAGVERDEAFRFSFLLSIPAVLGALTITLMKSAFDSTILPHILLGVVSAALVGYLSLATLRKLLMRGFFHWLGIYTIALGLTLLFVF